MVFAVAFDLRHVSTHRLPAPDLSRVLFWHSPADVVAAIPLKPSAGVVGMDPTLLEPQRIERIEEDALRRQRAKASLVYAVRDSA